MARDRGPCVLPLLHYRPVLGSGSGFTGGGGGDQSDPRKEILSVFSTSGRLSAAESDGLLYYSWRRKRIGGAIIFP